MVVDVTFLKRWQRDMFRRQAHTHGIRFVIMDVTAPEAALRARIAVRLAANSDASEADQAVLTRQLAQRDALGGEELQTVLPIDTWHADVEVAQSEACAALRARLTTPAADGRASLIFARVGATEPT